ncbi:MAG: NAD(+)/NADH kinase [Caldimicrobium thiodismutans]
MSTFLFFCKASISIPEEFLKTVEAFQITLKKIEELSEEEKPLGILVLGGDGTLLKAVPYAYQFDLPVIGVNMGKFGFLTEITLEELALALEKFLEGKVFLEERRLLKVTYEEKEEVVLNEGAILKGPFGKSITLNLKIDGEDFIEVYGDGLIVSTPTGSTAYNISAGGPVVHPKVRAFIITPICSFKINHRPFVIPEESILEVRLKEGEGEVHLLLDGRTNWFIEKEKRIIFTTAERPLKIVSSPTKSYFQILKEKFSW